MRTLRFPCGCWITQNMSDNDYYLSVSPCFNHQSECQRELKILADKIREINK